MKNKFLLIFITIFLSTKLFAENIFIEAKNISLDKEKEISIFRNDVTVKTIDKKITSQYAEYNKVIQEIILKDKIIAEDKFGNIIKADYAEYNNLEKMYKTVGPTTLITSEDYSLKGMSLEF